MKRDEFKNFLKEVILEVKKEKKEKESLTTPEKHGDKNYLNGEKNKFKRDLDNDPEKTVCKLMSQIEGIVKKIDKNITVVLDDHNDISIKFPGVFSIRVKPRWSGNFDIEAFRNMSDRVYAIALDNEQVLNFIKVNFSISKKCYVQSAYDKSMENLKDDSKKKSKDLPKGEPVKHKEVPDKDIKDQVTDKKDKPDAQLSVVDEKNIEKQSDHAIEKNKEMPKIQKMIKKEN